LRRCITALEISSSHQGAEDRVANRDRLQQETDRVKLVITFVPGERGNGDPDQEKGGADEIFRAEGEEMRKTFEQTVDDINRRVETQEDEE